MGKIEEWIAGRALDKLMREIRKFEKFIDQEDIKLAKACFDKACFDTIIKNGVRDGLLEQLTKMKTAIKVETPGEQKLLNRIISLEDRVKAWKVS